MESVNIEAIVRHTRRFAAPARTLIPPALLGYEPERIVYRPTSMKVENLEISIALSTAGKDSLKKVCEEIFQNLRNLGFRVRISENRAEELVTQEAMQEDLVLVVWSADYPDPDGIVSPLLYSKGGLWKNHFGTEEIDRMIEQARIETDLMNVILFIGELKRRFVTKPS